MKKIVLRHGAGELEVQLDHELTIGKLLSFQQVQVRLGFNYHNVHAVRDGEILDFETFIGAEDVVLVLEIRANTKGIKGREFHRKLVKLKQLKFLRSKGSHNIYQMPEGGIISIPHDSKEVPNGTARAILKRALPGTSLSEFISTKV